MLLFCCIFFFNDPATTEIYTLSLHDALPIWVRHDLPIGNKQGEVRVLRAVETPLTQCREVLFSVASGEGPDAARSEEHTSELQSRQYLVCRLLLEKKKTKQAHQNV